MSDPDVERLRGVLAAYHKVMSASWPTLHSAMAERSRHWPTATQGALERELRDYIDEASQPACTVRVFWKLGPKLEFAGCNEHFAHDAGIPTAELIGMDDFNPRLPWALQAAKYRADDDAVVATALPKLDILERQKSSTGTITWVRAGKAPIRNMTGQVLGLLGMYEILDAATGRKLFGEQQRKKASES